jgi:hypothetical protein
VEDDCLKKSIVVKFNGLEFPVSWYADTENRDVKDAVLCACDSIIDSGFELVDPDGNQVDFSKLTQLPGEGEIYHLYEGEEKKEL